MNPCTTPLDRALRRLAKQRLKEAEAAFHRWRAGADGEALHDFRVALRRLRALFQVFAGDVAHARALRRPVKRLAGLSNEARDLEVALGWVERCLPELGGQAGEAAQAFRDALAGEQEAAEARLRDALPKRWKKTRRRLRRGLAGLSAERPPTLAQAAAARIPQGVGGLDAALGAIEGVGDEAGIHAARLAGKRLRYLLEPFRDQIPAAARAVEALKALQDDLGAVHDLQVLLHRAQAALARDCATVSAAWARSAFLHRPAPAWRPPPLTALCARLGERARAHYARLPSHRGADAPWRAPALEAAAALRDCQAEGGGGRL